MKFVSDKPSLSRLLSQVSRVAASSQEQSIIKSLKNLLIEANKSDSITITATDTELTVIAAISAKVIKTGKTTIPAKIFSDYISRIPAKEVEISTDDDSSQKVNPLVISWGKNNNQATLKRNCRVDEFPIIPKINQNKENQLYKNINKALLKKGLNSVLFAINRNQTDRQLLTAGYLYVNDKQILLVGTDSYRLSEHSLGSQSKTVEPILIPGKTLEYIKAIIDDHGSNINIYRESESQQVLFDFDDLKIISRLMSGSYPAYQPLLPTKDKFISTVTVNCDVFLKHINLAGTLCERDGSRTVVLDCQAKSKSGPGGRLGVNPPESQTGSSDTAIENVEISDDIKLSIDYTFIKQILEQLNQPGIDDQKVFIGIAGTIKPCVFLEDSSLNGQKYSFRHAIMPVRADH